MPGQNEPVAGVVSFAAANERSRPGGAARALIPISPQRTPRRPPGVFHEHQPQDAVLLGRAAIDSRTCSRVK